VTTPIELTAGERAFVTHMGEFYNRLIPQTPLGHIMGLLLVADRPVAVEEIADTLALPLPEVAAFMPAFIQMGLVKPIPDTFGQRYQMRPDAWVARLQAGIDMMAEMQGLADEGLAGLGEGKATARQRLLDMKAFLDVVAQETPAMMDRWRQQRAA
jgi:hypothetical protein